MTENQGIVHATGDVARICSVRKMTVIRWVERGELKAHQLPGRGDRRIAHADLLDFMRRHNLPLPREFQSSACDVLVVDDDYHVARAIQRLLIHADLRSEIALDGFRAGALLEKLRPPLVTLDLMMPGMNGYDVLRFLREREDLREIRVLVISALPAEKLAEAVAAGADEALSKPFAGADLLEKATRLLGIRRPPLTKELS